MYNQFIWNIEKVTCLGPQFDLQFLSDWASRPDTPKQL